MATMIYNQHPLALTNSYSAPATYMPQYVPSPMIQNSRSAQFPQAQAQTQRRPSLRIVRSSASSGLIEQTAQPSVVIPQAPMPMHPSAVPHQYIRHASPSPSPTPMIHPALIRQSQSVSFPAREHVPAGRPVLMHSASAPVHQESNNSRKSSRPCFRMIRNGFCNVPNCRFYHIDPTQVNEERSDNRPPCMSFLKRGFCNDSQCIYRHDEACKSGVAEPKIDVNGLVPAHEPEENERKLCYDFANKGVCKYGAHCRYKHIQRVCYEFVNKGTCSREARGEKCKYLHTADQKFQLCPEFLRTGSCARQGKGCRFKHEKRNSQRKKEEMKDSRIGVEIAKCPTPAAVTPAGTPLRAASATPTRSPSPLTVTQVPQAAAHPVPMMAYPSATGPTVQPQPQAVYLPTMDGFLCPSYPQQAVPFVYNCDPTGQQAPMYVPAVPAMHTLSSTTSVGSETASESPSTSPQPGFPYVVPTFMKPVGDDSMSYMSTSSEQFVPTTSGSPMPYMTTTYLQPTQSCPTFLAPRAQLANSRSESPVEQTSVAQASFRSLPDLGGHRMRRSVPKPCFEDSSDEISRPQAKGFLFEDSDDEEGFVSCECETPEPRDMTLTPVCN